MRAGVYYLMKLYKPCVVIPVYNHNLVIREMVQAVIKNKLVCILVDDGSVKTCADILDQIAAISPCDVILLRHTSNSGKGSAVMTGIRHAAKLGYTHALQIDADGQHNSDDIPKFIAMSFKHPSSVIIGCPLYDHTVPKSRLYARYLTHIWIWINTLSFNIKDSMCGFRLYPIAAIIKCDQENKLGEYMDFDPEILVRLHWNGLNMINLSTAVTYACDGVSHFRLIKDNILISRLHAKLFLGMLWRLPALLARKF